MSDGLRVDALRFGYHDSQEVLRGVDLEVAPGQVTALLGPNGSGKSTLLRVATGLLRPWGGSVSWRGQDLGSLSRRERAQQVAFLPQRVEPLYRYRVREVVELGRHPHLGRRLDPAARRQAVDAAMAACEVLGLSARPFDELSGGERQRVLLAACLAQGGELLVLDEPTTSLDLHHQVAFMNLLRRRAAQGQGILCATHDLNLAATHADQLVLLDEGRIVARGGAREVLREELLRQVFGDGLWVGPHPGGAAACVLPLPHEGAAE